MDLQSLDWQWYEPEIGGNRTAEAPMAVELKTPSFGYVRGISSRALKTGPEKFEYDRDQFAAHVRGVRNLTLDGKPILTGAELWKLGAEENRIAADLFIEIFRALDDKAKLREGVAAGLPGPSDSA